MREPRSHGHYLLFDEWACLQWYPGTLPEDDGDSQWLEVNWEPDGSQLSGERAFGWKGKIEVA